MSYGALGVVFGLAVFLVANVALSLVAAVLARRLCGSDPSRHPESHAQRLFVLRMLPVTASFLLVLGVFVPSYLLHEPAHQGEAVGWTLPALALGAVLLVAVTVGRGIGSWRGTRRLVRRWLSEAVRVDAAEGVPLYRIRDPFPVVSLAGLRRPRILVAGQVLDALGPDERRAVVAHELAHWRARDNLRRLLLRGSPDLLSLLPAGRRLEQAWTTATEMAADAAASHGGATAAVDLAAALVTVARLAPEGTRLAWPASALHDGEDVARRARRLLTDHSAVPVNRGRDRAIKRTALLIVAALAAVVPGLLAAAHRLTEAVVRTLP